jgi:hypothetical protein
MDTFTLFNDIYNEDQFKQQANTYIKNLKRVNETLNVLHKLFNIENYTHDSIMNRFFKLSETQAYGNHEVATALEELNTEDRNNNEKILEVIHNKINTFLNNNKKYMSLKEYQDLMMLLINKG